LVAKTLLAREFNLFSPICQLRSSRLCEAHLEMSGFGRIDERVRNDSGVSFPRVVRSGNVESSPVLEVFWSRIS